MFIARSISHIRANDFETCTASGMSMRVKLKAISQNGRRPLALLAWPCKGLMNQRLNAAQGRDLQMSAIRISECRRSCHFRRVVALSVGLLLSASYFLDAQVAVPATQPKLAFDVASVRQNLSGDDAQGANSPHVNFPIGSDDAYYDTGGVFSATNLPLISYLIFAYKITNNNRQALLDSTPDWVKSEHYNIEARTDLKDVSKDQMRLMMQALLEERFNIAVHREVRSTKVYSAELIEPDKLGPQLRAHSKTTQCPDAAPNPSPISTPTKPQFSFDPSGFPEVCGRFVNSIKSSIEFHRRFGGGGQPISTIISSFTGVGNLDRPVVDRTGLIGLFDFVLEFLPDPVPGKQLPHDADGPDFIGAVRAQLGIKLAADKAPIEFVLVDRISRPTPN